MKKIFVYLLAPLSCYTALVGCKKMEVGIMNTGNYTDTSTYIKDAATADGFPFGLAIDYAPMMNNPVYSGTVAREATSVTFTYQMKHGAIVQNDGSLNYTNTDALVNKCVSAGLQIYGHTLGWHQNQNATYLKNYAGITIPAATELLANPGFELGAATTFSNWSTYNAANGATISVTTTPSQVHSGTRAMMVVNPVANPGSQWKVQVASDLFNTVVGQQYTISYWVYAASTGGSIRLSTQTSGGGSAQYQADQNIGTSWQLVTWTITANSTQTRILFDMGQAANTYYIDDASVKQVVTAPSGSQIAVKLDSALYNFITNTVTRYKGVVKAWDVINELFADNGTLRNNSNTTTTGSDVLVWSNYMGNTYALHAFQYAQAADPDALLFINDYSLESNSVKLDSLISYVKFLKANGAKVDGIGTQMHIAWNITYAGIDAMFQKLAATGLLIRISELDIRINPNDKTGFTPNQLFYGYQADMYNYVVNSYLKYIPKAQRYGITVWGVDDPESWIVTTQNKVDYPLLFNANFGKKPAYTGMLNALKTQQ
ncbi:endo-1,4-beta-xylanase [Hydrotalea sp.]|uniref:endo-1,4-beta-xylanase n=1 Tax=Hydrotalea sp. TaxID=2881279 RepID=UPI003D0E8E74